MISRHADHIYLKIELRCNLTYRFFVVLSHECLVFFFRTWCGGVGSAKGKREADIRRTKQGPEEGNVASDAAEEPPEVEMKDNGADGEKGDTWRSMRMVQCLRYHKVRLSRQGNHLSCCFISGVVCFFVDCLRCWLP